MNWNVPGTILQIPLSYTLPFSTDRTPRDNREKSDRTFLQKFAFFYSNLAHFKKKSYLCSAKII